MRKVQIDFQAFRHKNPTISVGCFVASEGRFG